MDLLKCQYFTVVCYNWYNVLLVSRLNHHVLTLSVCMFYAKERQCVLYVCFNYHHWTHTHVLNLSITLDLNCHLSKKVYTGYDLSGLSIYKSNCEIKFINEKLKQELWSNYVYEWMMLDSSDPTKQSFLSIF